jgi:hypothetical protein
VPEYGTLTASAWSAHTIRSGPLPRISLRHPGDDKAARCTVAEDTLDGWVGHDGVGGVEHARGDQLGGEEAAP